jgi:hypothetical protein
VGKGCVEDDLNSGALLSLPQHHFLSISLPFIINSSRSLFSCSSPPSPPLSHPYLNIVFNARKKDRAKAKTFSLLGCLSLLPPTSDAMRLSRNRRREGVDMNNVGKG